MASSVGFFLSLGGLLLNLVAGVACIISGMCTCALVHSYTTTILHWIWVYNYLVMYSYYWGQVIAFLNIKCLSDWNEIISVVDNVGLLSFLCQGWPLITILFSSGNSLRILRIQLFSSWGRCSPPLPERFWLLSINEPSCSLISYCTWDLLGLSLLFIIYKTYSWERFDFSSGVIIAKGTVLSGNQFKKNGTASFN